MTRRSTTDVLLTHGVHEFVADVKPQGAPKGACYPCKVCRMSRKHPAHRGAPTTVAASDEKTVLVSCPTCQGTGTFPLDMADVVALARRKAGRA
jgi:hypothetical protein